MGKISENRRGGFFLDSHCISTYTATLVEIDAGSTLYSKLKQSVLTAVFTDVHDMQNRKRNIIVSDLQPSRCDTDAQLVSKL